MKPLLLLQPSAATLTTPSFFLPLSPPPSFNSFSTPLHRFHSPPHRHYCYHFPLLRSSLPHNNNYSSLPAALQPQPPRTLFPGGYKRPEIKVPNIVLQLDPDDVLHQQQGGSSGYDDALDFVDKMVSKWVGIVVLNAGGGSGKRLYDAACLLKSVVRDRAYLLIGERVDIAAAINASGVLLSDQGLPAIVARNMMMDAKSEAVVLPLVARNVRTPAAAFNASNSEGADFIVYSVGQDKRFDLPINSGFKDVKIPIFVAYGSGGETVSFVEASDFLKRGASGLVMSLEELKLFGDNALSQLFNTGSVEGEIPHVELESNNNFRQLDASVVPGKKRLAGFVKLEDKEKQLIETEKSVLLEAINALQRAAPLMKEVSLLIDAVSQIDEPFLLAIVGEFNSGKSTVINALLGKRYLKEGVIPTTNEITFLCYAEYNYEEQQHCERHPDGQYICYLPAPILRQIPKGFEGITHAM